MAGKPRRRIPDFLIYQDTFLQEADGLGDGGLLIPPVDLYETPRSYVLDAELPGVNAGDVHVQVRGAELSIWGERKTDSCCADESYHRLESMRGRFHRTFKLPQEVGEDAKIQANLKDGILHVEIAKSATCKNIAIRPPGIGE